MSQPNLSAVKVIAEKVAKGNMPACALASCILILTNEMEKVKKKVENREV